MGGHVVPPESSEPHSLGSIEFAILASSKETAGGFAVLEFAGSEGAWTVPHMHREMEESFYVLEGTFTFTLDGNEITARPGTFILVPRGTPHVLRAESGGGRLLTVTVPGGLEEMFKELSTLPPLSITDPQVRSRIAARYDSVPGSSTLT